METEGLLNFVYSFDLGIWGLVILAMFATVLLTGLNIFSRWHWLVKTSATLLLLAVWLTAYHTISAWSGNPSTGEMPEEFLFVWAVIIEPEERVGGDPGRIYMTVRERDGAEVDDVPRTFELPYFKETHVELNAMMRNVCFGKQIAGKKKKGTDMVLREKGKFKGLNPPQFDWEDFSVIGLPPKMSGNELQEFLRSQQEERKRMLEEDILIEQELEQRRRERRDRHDEEHGVEVLPQEGDTRPRILGTEQ